MHQCKNLHLLTLTGASTWVVQHHTIHTILKRHCMNRQLYAALSNSTMSNIAILACYFYPLGTPRQDHSHQFNFSEHCDFCFTTSSFTRRLQDPAVAS